jgi:hypothetical protein
MPLRKNKEGREPSLRLLGGSPQAPSVTYVSSGSAAFFNRSGFSFETSLIDLSISHCKQRES